ncbi:ribonuclease HII [Persicimonas caeni]|uniref:Ribonuclease HII n=1 Tax=Persicimonas caeni TaxID=2292766 RepID=A0A4Y6PNZ5_PERCE|nr:ribonuclease HII [Persicimonas caeni]QDG49980.1 ribonuclease HII [Persicimonas caeni]QED31201.1 ribonuclease HII [Persicimonas caeni]
MSQQNLFQKGEPVIGELEDWCVSQGYRFIIGVDEAGRGPLAGPVYASAVAIDLEALEEPWLELLDDSKKLEQTRREEAFELIQASAPAFSITFSDHAVIDEINILQATHRAMEAAVAEVCEQLDGPPDYVFIDGNMPVKLSLPQRAVVKGDARSRAIAAASILAKVSRDEVMARHHEQWPEYGFASNKGYPTKQHRDAVAEYGPCPIHRLTFGGVREYRDKLRK